MERRKVSMVMTNAIFTYSVIQLMATISGYGTSNAWIILIKHNTILKTYHHFLIGVTSGAEALI